MADGHRHLLSAKGAMLSQPGPTGRVWAIKGLMRPEGARYSGRERTQHMLPIASPRSPRRVRMRPGLIGIVAPATRSASGLRDDCAKMRRGR